MNDTEFRQKHIGASEVAAFLGLHPRLTPWQLYHLKTGGLSSDDLSGNERVEWGVRLEPVIIEALRSKGRDVRAWPQDQPISKGGFGGHPDASEYEDGKRVAIIETKTADWLVFRDWGEEPPAHYLLQLQSYMGLAGVDRGQIAVLVGGNQLHTFDYAFRPALFEALVGHVRAFWANVAEGNEPSPDFLHDSAAISQLYRDRDGGAHVDFTGDNFLTDALHRFIDARAREKAAKDEKEAAGAEIRAKLGEASTATCGTISISYKRSKDTPPTVITPEMVGDTFGGRAGSRSLLVKEKAPKKEKVNG